eukprot:224999-Pelagomonas_calceolata.AAC.1
MGVSPVTIADKGMGVRPVTTAVPQLHCKDRLGQAAVPGPISASLTKNSITSSQRLLICDQARVIQLSQGTHTLGQQRCVICVIDCELVCQSALQQFHGWKHGLCALNRNSRSWRKRAETSSTHLVSHGPELLCVIVIRVLAFRWHPVIIIASMIVIIVL